MSTPKFKRVKCRFQCPVCTLGHNHTDDEVKRYHPRLVRFAKNYEMEIHLTTKDAVDLLEREAREMEAAEAKFLKAAEKRYREFLGKIDAQLECAPGEQDIVKGWRAKRKELIPILRQQMPWWRQSVSQAKSGGVQ